MSMDFNNETSQIALRSLIEGSKKIVVLTGAGVSTDSGIPDFKTTDSNWPHDFSREQATSMHFFKRNPELFWEIYRELFESKVSAEPNKFHRWISSLEADHDVTVLTQNVDGLHTAAGSSKVFEMHGNTKKIICVNRDCRAMFAASEFLEDKTPSCPDCGKVLKPDVCLFDENVKYVLDASEAIIAADLLIVAGTSLDVGPVNMLPRIAELSKRKINRLWINLEDAPYGYDFTHSHVGSLKNFLKSFKTPALAKAA
jgi:NAD-dependent SIR2 family protein deacetylase